MKRNICEICNTKILTDIHHICSKSCGGNNNKNNLTELCCNCHRLVHTGEIILEGRFFTSNCIIGEIWRNKENVSINGLFNDPKITKIISKENT